MKGVVRESASVEITMRANVSNVSSVNKEFTTALKFN